MNSHKHRRHPCPNCGESASVYRSKRRSFAENVLHRILFVTPYRCLTCDVRFFDFRPLSGFHPMRPALRVPTLPPSAGS